MKKNQNPAISAGQTEQVKNAETINGVAISVIDAAIRDYVEMCFDTCFDNEIEYIRGAIEMARECMQVNTDCVCTEAIMSELGLLDDWDDEIGDYIDDKLMDIAETYYVMANDEYENQLINTAVEKVGLSVVESDRLMDVFKSCLEKNDVWKASEIYTKLRKAYDDFYMAMSNIDGRDISEDDGLCYFYFRDDLDTMENDLILTVESIWDEMCELDIETAYETSGECEAENVRELHYNGVYRA